MRTDDIDANNSIIFPATDNKPDDMYKQIEQCIPDISGGAKLMSPDDLTSMDSFNEVIHVTVNSMFFGFIDDLYIIVKPYPFPIATTSDRLVLNLQSQLRMGGSDFMQNYDHIELLLTCLNKKYDNSFESPRPCSKT